MYIDSPIWRLKQRCPCPSCQESYLELYTCDECKTMFAICDEANTVFLDPLDITMDKISWKDKGVCENCGSVGKLRPAKDYEVIALGLTIADYE